MLPSTIRDFLVITTLDEGEPFFGPLFERKFGHPVPDYPSHLGVFYRAGGDQFMPLSYIHYLHFGDIILVGGCSTDGNVYARMSEAERNSLSESGGPMLHALRYGFAYYADRCDAFFGYCGDSRALEVDLQAGFERTEHEKLLVRWTRPPDEMHRRCLLAKAHAIGPF